MSAVKLMVLYPQPKNVPQFEQDYQAHIALLHEQMDIPTSDKPYSVTKMMAGPAGAAPFYQMFSMPFPDIGSLKGVLSSAAMQTVAADASRISSGGEPVVLIGTDT